MRIQRLVPTAILLLLLSAAAGAGVPRVVLGEVFESIY